MYKVLILILMLAFAGSSFAQLGMSEEEYNRWKEQQLAEEEEEEEEEWEPGEEPEDEEEEFEMRDRQPETLDQRMSYSMGVRVGRSLGQSGFEYDLEMLFLGISDSLHDRGLRMDDKEMQEALQNLASSVQQKAAEINLQNAEDFLNKNIANPDVEEMPSGVQYRVIREGSGERPRSTDWVRAHYRGTFLNGQEFENTYQYQQPAEFRVNTAPEGMQDALVKMNEGAKWQIFLPPEKAYGEMGRPGIPPNSLVIFDLELVEVIGQNQSR